MSYLSGDENNHEDQGSSESEDESTQNYKSIYM